MRVRNSKVEQRPRRASKRKHEDTAKRWREYPVDKLFFTNKDTVLIDVDYALVGSGSFTSLLHDMSKQIEELQNKLRLTSVHSGYGSPMVVGQPYEGNVVELKGSGASHTPTNQPGNEAEDLDYAQLPRSHDDNVVPITPTPYKAPEDAVASNDSEHEDDKPDKLVDPELEGDFQRLAAAYGFDFMAVAGILGEEYSARDGHCRLTHRDAKGKAQSYDTVRLDRMIQAPHKGYGPMRDDTTGLLYWSSKCPKKTSYVPARKAESSYQFFDGLVRAFEYQRAICDDIDRCHIIAEKNAEKALKRSNTRLKLELHALQLDGSGYQKSKMEKVARRGQHHANPRTSMGQLRKLWLSVRDIGDDLRRLFRIGKVREDGSITTPDRYEVDRLMYRAARVQDSKFSKYVAWKEYITKIWGVDAWKGVLAQHAATRLARQQGHVAPTLEQALDAILFEENDTRVLEASLDAILGTENSSPKKGSTYTTHPPMRRGQRPIEGHQVRRYLSMTGAGH